MNLLLSGATGFLGKAMLALLADDRQYDRFFLLLRPRGRDTPEDRVRDLVDKVVPPGKRGSLTERVVAVPGDLTQPRLGLHPDSYRELKESVQQILHLGASTDFTLPIDEARRVNVDGTRSLLELAESALDDGHDIRFDYVSTAYVAGSLTPGEVSESDLRRGQRFANTYEQTKFEAEVLVHDARHGLTTTVYRPSIIVGDSHTGYTSDFKVLYWPLRFLARGVLPFIPSNPAALLDIVPVDYVASGIHELMRSPVHANATYHLTAGRGNEVKVGEFLHGAADAGIFRLRPIIPVWAFELFMRGPWRHFLNADAWQQISVGLPYLNYIRGVNVTFNADRTQAVLAAAGIEVPLWEDYRERIFSYVKDTSWGKRRPYDEYEYYQSFMVPLPV